MMQTFHFSSTCAHGRGRRGYFYCPTEDPVAGKMNEAEMLYRGGSQRQPTLEWKETPSGVNMYLRPQVLSPFLMPPLTRGGENLTWGGVLSPPFMLPILVCEAYLTGRSSFLRRLCLLSPKNKSFLGMLNCSVRVSLLILPKFSIRLHE